MSVRLNWRLDILGVTLSAFLAFAGLAMAHGDHEAKSEQAATASAAASPDAIAAYPLKTCVVSGESLEGDDADEPFNLVYKSEGHPDRLVRLCCKNCVKKFNANPEKYLKKIDEAAAKAKE